MIRSKLRDIKRNKDIYLKMNVISERFSQKVHCDEIYVLQQLVKKMLSYNPESREEMPEVFASLDQGAAIDISGIDDTYVQAKLFKIFKIMRLRKSKDNQLEFRKKLEKDIHNFSFEKFIQFVFKQVIENESSSENDITSEELVSDNEN